jgi:hypothetical protein
MLDPLRLSSSGELEPGTASLTGLIEAIAHEPAWVRISGPRQCGKTTGAEFVRRTFHGRPSPSHRGEEWTFRVATTSFEGLPSLQDATWEGVDKAILATILTDVAAPLADEGDDTYTTLYNQGNEALASSFPALQGNRTSTFLEEWTSAERKRKTDVILIIDEMDSLPLHHLARLLHVLRELFLLDDEDGERLGMWGAVFITHRPLASLSYLVKEEGKDDRMERVDRSPLNVFNVNYRPPYFSPASVRELLDMHTKATEQQFEPGVVEEICKQTGGHPWLVNYTAQSATEAAARRVASASGTETASCGELPVVKVVDVEMISSRGRARISLSRTSVGAWRMTCA